ncbi:MAG: hypothetical protein KAJ07_00370 [Planctomycetes bacterium]|nr:hypothetical protein [Planctomycetota bacterium]
MSHKYQIVNGTAYCQDTSKEMIAILERLKANQTRARFHWGDTKTGKDWGDVWGVRGTIGRSTGRIKIPLLIHNSRSLGGGGMLDHCIVKITYANKKDGGTIYQHPKYHQ